MSLNGLRRSLGLFPATNIVIANIIGAGIFTTSGLLMADLGSPVLLIIPVSYTHLRAHET